MSIDSEMISYFHNQRNDYGICDKIPTTTLIPNTNQLLGDEAKQALIDRSLAKDTVNITGASGIVNPEASLSAKSTVKKTARNKLKFFDNIKEKASSLLKLAKKHKGVTAAIAAGTALVCGVVAAALANKNKTVQEATTVVQNEQVADAQVINE